jgi:hypothetical protein
VNALPMTIAVLILMLLTGGAQLRRDLDRELLSSCLLSHLQIRLAQEIAAEETHYALQVQSRKKPEPREDSTPRPKGKGTGTRRKIEGLPSKLSFIPILMEDEKANHFRTILLNLMELLYGDQPFFDREQAEEILTKLRAIEWKPELTRLEQLATVDLEDTALQALWLKMLRGQTNGYDSILNHISLHEKKRTKINLTHAPEELLKAIFGPIDEVKTFHHDVDKLIKKYNDKRSDSDGLSAQQFRADVQQMADILRERHTLFPQDLFDYSVQHRPGSITIEAEDNSRRLTLKSRRSS